MDYPAWMTDPNAFKSIAEADQAKQAWLRANEPWRYTTEELTNPQNLWGGFNNPAISGVGGSIQGTPGAAFAATLPSTYTPVKSYNEMLSRPTYEYSNMDVIEIVRILRPGLILNLQPSTNPEYTEDDILGLINYLRGVR